MLMLKLLRHQLLTLSPKLIKKPARLLQMSSLEMITQHKQQIFAFLEHTMSIRNLGSMMHSGGVINHHIQYQKCILDHGYLAKQCQSVSRDEMVPKEHCKVQQHHKEPKCFSHI